MVYEETWFEGSGGRHTYSCTMDESRPNAQLKHLCSSELNNKSIFDLKHEDQTVK